MSKLKKTPGAFACPGYTERPGDRTGEGSRSRSGAHSQRVTKIAALNVGDMFAPRLRQSREERARRVHTPAQASAAALLAVLSFVLSCANTEVLSVARHARPLPKGERYNPTQDS